jgi:hypothetical protein
MGTEKQGIARALPFSSVKTCPNFQRKYTSAAEDLFHFIRSWKIVAEILCLTMVI